MNFFLNKLHTLGVAVLAACSFSAMAADTFTMNGRVVQLEPAPATLKQGRSSGASAPVTPPKPDARVIVRDVTTGRVSVYAEGLIITLRAADQLKGVLQDYPALTLQYAPGVHAYVRVPRDELPATFDALGADPRVAAVHLRPVPVKLKPR